MLRATDSPGEGTIQIRQGCLIWSQGKGFRAINRSEKADFEVKTGDLNRLGVIYFSVNCLFT